MADSTDYSKWLERAFQDMRLIDIIKKDGIGGLEDSFCYTCHQAAEKFFKAFLLFKRRRIPRTHDLVYLLNGCVMSDRRLKELEDEVLILNEYSVSSRYPSDFDEPRTEEEAEEAYNCIMSIRRVFGEVFNSQMD
jgi:HEPN domain-containing protein